MTETAPRRTVDMHCASAEMLRRSRMWREVLEKVEEFEARKMPITGKRNFLGFENAKLRNLLSIAKPSPGSSDQCILF